MPLSMAVAQGTKATLKVGDAAPALKVAEWVKGQQVKSFATGKVYVVEFWATWCGPCKQSIPHLTELAKKYQGKATFLGVSVWENQDPSDSSYFPKVRDFVKGMGDKMDYVVCIDDPTGTMSNTWMKAAGQNGIPTAFVVDQKGKVAWIGHPMADLDEVLQQVIDGKYDSKAAARAKEEEGAKMMKLQADMEKVFELAQTGQGKEALALIDKVIGEHPKMKVPLSMAKFEVMLQVDEPGAYKFAKLLGENEFKNDAMMLNQLAWTIVEGKPPVSKPDYDVAIALAQRSVDLQKAEDPYSLDTLAFAHFKKGNVDKAIELQEKAVALMNKPGMEVDAQTKKEIEERLAMFKKKKAGG